MKQVDVSPQPAIPQGNGVKFENDPIKDKGLKDKKSKNGHSDETEIVNVNEKNMQKETEDTQKLEMKP